MRTRGCASRAELDKRPFAPGVDGMVGDEIRGRYSPQEEGHPSNDSAHVSDRSVPPALAVWGLEQYGIPLPIKRLGMKFANLTLFTRIQEPLI